MNTVSFKATKFSTISVKMRNGDGEFKEKNIVAAKMNPDSKLDYNSTLDISDLWGDAKPNYVESMLHHSAEFIDNEKRSVYFLTEQTENFRKIIPEKVLGMFEITKHENHYRLNFIQTRPDSKYGTTGRKYKGIGWAMLIMADKISKGEKIILSAVRKAINFYKKYGYVVTYDKCNYPRMVLNKRTLIK